MIEVGVSAFANQVIGFVVSRRQATKASDETLTRVISAPIRHRYGRGDATTNTVEGFFSIFKRGMKGVYQHCGEQHLHRYLSEFDFRYSERVALGVNDKERAAKAVKGVVGKRLTYRQPDRQEGQEARA